ncbi:MAG: AAA family ATPase [Omnitrophica bacterium RIFCSPLOWO2_12_FULL_50_11]|nr:MAG: AAA family ATPase [Omnitrophica bacterium RIFCSPLOWO2_12_FULL_50_11]
MKTSEDTLTLQVTEAQAKDVGRGIARIDPKDMAKLHLEVGEIVELEGKRKTVAKVMPSFPEDRGKRTVQIDGLVRENAKVGLGEKISLLKAASKPAERIVLTPLTLVRTLRYDRDQKYIGTLLEGLPMMAGDRIRANLFGARSCDFEVLDTTPKGAVVIHPGTAIKMEAEEAARGKRGTKISYEDIGGLGREIERVREMIELPLKYPQIFERLGIEAPKGVFLYGPPGCGKTLIARAVANETDAYFTSISGPEIMGKFYGESEARLRNVFEDAQAHAPSIIFIDEIDAIAPKREEMGGEKQVERRVVAQLLSLMDGIESRGQVIVIAATNIPNVIDPALRRPGRFDREISIPIPDRKARREILDIHTRGMPLAKDVDLDRISEVTHGFVGADLEALCRESAMTCLREVLPQVNFELDEIPYELVSKLEVSQTHFMEAMREVEPSAIREVFIEVPNVKWDEVGGLREVKQKLIEAVEWPLKHEAVFREANLEPPKGILLYGPPGTGKTLIAKALATESEVNFIAVKGPELISKYVGESERGIREIFRKAKQAAPTIVFFDEIDALLPIRGRSGGDSQVTERVISQFLTELDGIEKLKGVLVLGATNRLELVDPAVLRTGRFDFLLEVPIPDEKTREAIFKIHTKGKPFDKDVDLGDLAEKTEGLVGSDIEAISREATLGAVRNFLNEKKEKKKLVISKSDFLEALKNQKERCERRRI